MVRLRRCEPGSSSWYQPPQLSRPGAVHHIAETRYKPQASILLKHPYARSMAKSQLKRHKQSPLYKPPFPPPLAYPPLQLLPRQPVLHKPHRHPELLHLPVRPLVVKEEHLVVGDPRPSRQHLEVPQLGTLVDFQSGVEDVYCFSAFFVIIAITTTTFSSSPSTSS